ncbi:MAG TPA: 50S ribosomal protein L10 [Candidatus Paceibacterota bacterium]|nr:50S ribosomal protein L10 [Candidatus Paceibacterota bacterium]
MAISKEKKGQIVASFSDILKGAETVVFVQFKGLTVKAANALRRKLTGAGVGYKVGKKTLLTRVLNERGYKGELPELSGEIAIAYGTDQIAPAREVYEFQKTNKDMLAIAGGIFEGEYKTKEAMLSIATIPSREVLLSQLAYLLKSPIQRLAIAVNEIAKQKSA